MGIVRSTLRLMVVSIPQQRLWLLLPGQMYWSQVRLFSGVVPLLIPQRMARISQQSGPPLQARAPLRKNCTTTAEWVHLMALSLLSN